MLYESHFNERNGSHLLKVELESIYPFSRLLCEIMLDCSAWGNGIVYFCGKLLFYCTDEFLFFIICTEVWEFRIQCASLIFSDVAPFSLGNCFFESNYREIGITEKI